MRNVRFPAIFFKETTAKIAINLIIFFNSLITVREIKMKNLSYEWIKKKIYDNVVWITKILLFVTQMLMNRMKRDNEWRIGNVIQFPYAKNLGNDKTMKKIKWKTKSKSSWNQIIFHIYYNDFYVLVKARIKVNN